MKDTVIISENGIEKTFAKEKLPISKKIERAHIILSSLNLKYIQVPKKLYYNDSNIYIKYNTPFFKDSQNKYEKIFLTEIKSFLQNLKELEQEIDVITEKHILMRDVYSKNTTFDETLRIINPGSYTYEKERNIDKIRFFNYEKLRSLVISLIYEALKCKNIDKEDLYGLIMQLNSETRKYHSITSYLENIENKDQTLESYILTKLKKK